MDIVKAQQPAEKGNTEKQPGEETAACFEPGKGQVFLGPKGESSRNRQA